LKGMRTLFNAFHHFKPAHAQAILADAVAKNQPIGVFEIVGRTPGAVASVLLAVLSVFVLMPTIKPRRPIWWICTYIVPLIPLLALWDGLVSCMRVYSPRELDALIAGVEGSERFSWEIKRARLPYKVASATILIGLPLTPTRPQRKHAQS
ncbi:MAG: hypothetical protein ACYS22_12575, partial [Planctomycetota bacterium]